MISCAQMRHMPGASITWQVMTWRDSDIHACMQGDTGQSIMIGVYEMQPSDWRIPATDIRSTTAAQCVILKSDLPALSG
jgi:hypothetical protein